MNPQPTTVPEPPEGPVNPEPPTDTANPGAVLLGRVRAGLVRYVILPSPEAYDAVTLWIAATHGVPYWAHAPRLVIRAPEKRCGKSRLLDIVCALCWSPLITVNASSAAVYRSIGTTDPPTLLIDEADTIFGPKAESANEDLRGLLNAGHQRNRAAVRYDAAKQRVEHIATFAMAALAGIGVMPDTIEDRAVVIRMRRRAPGETVSPFRERRDGAALHTLARELNRWVRSHGTHLTDAEPAMPVEDRAADTWEPLIAVADLAGDTWPARARAACVRLTADRDAATEVPLKVRLLIDCRTAFGAEDALASAELLDRLKADPEAPWADLGGTGLTARRLSSLLREYDIGSGNVRFPDGTQAKGYRRGDFADSWDRYCPPSPTAAPEGTPQGAEPVGETYPSQPSQASHPWSARDGLFSWDGLSVPDQDSVPGLTCTGTAGTDGTDTAPATCITCRTPLTFDDGTHTHPACESA